MINFVCCSVVVDNCDYTPDELLKKLKKWMPTSMAADVKITGAYYPRQRLINVPSAEHAKQVLFALHNINDEDKEAA